MATYTPEQLANELAVQVAAAYRQVENRILPARLSNSHTNAVKIVVHLMDNNLAPTAENVYSTINALAFDLSWDVEPEKVRAKKLNERPATIQSALKQQECGARRLKLGKPPT